MRDVANQQKILRFMRVLGSRTRGRARVYFTGGATAVLLGWRDATIDVNLRFEPERDELFRPLQSLKEELGINIELASPPDFIPTLAGWEQRSRFVTSEGKLDFYHYDPCSQALSKIERGHVQDEADVSAMLRDGLIEREKLRAFYKAIEPQLYRYPAIDPESFTHAVNRFVEA